MENTQPVMNQEKEKKVSWTPFTIAVIVTSLFLASLFKPVAVYFFVFTPFILLGTPLILGINLAFQVVMLLRSRRHPRSFIIQLLGILVALCVFSLFAWYFISLPRRGF